MTLPYNRNFKSGRQSDQFLNEESHRIYTALKNINYKKEEKAGIEPESNLDGALWFDKIDNQLKYYDQKTHSWKCVFSSLFQITNNITSLKTPTDPVVGQLWIYNGVLMYFDGSQWKPIKALEQSNTQWSNAAFEDFQIVSPLNPDYTFSKTDDTIYNTNYASDAQTIWSSETGLEYEDNYPTYKEPQEEVVNRYLIPNLNTDRLFLDNDLDTEYKEINDISFEYPETKTAEKILTGVHINPGKISNITKRIFKIDKDNPSIEINAYNTEFYGFRYDKLGGDFLVPSKSQDIGDYIVSGDNIILNRQAAQNYDYVVAVRYEFTWAKANGTLSRYSSKDPISSFYIANMRQEDIAVHINGLMLEEASYVVDKEKNTITFEDDLSGFDLDIWAPFSKQYGYIRTTQLDGTGIIKLKEPVKKPLVFVGGLLMDPEKISEDNPQGELKEIRVTNNVSGIESMQNLPWCVIELYDFDNPMNSSAGSVVQNTSDSATLSSIELEGNDTAIINNETISSTTNTTDVTNTRIYNCVLDAGVVENADSFYIPYDPDEITTDMGVIVFVNGLLICGGPTVAEDENGEKVVLEHIIKDPERRRLYFPYAGLQKGDTYVVLKDSDNRLYSYLDIEPVYNTGFISECLIYSDGKLLLGYGSGATYNSPEVELLNNPIDGECKYFITKEYQEGTLVYYEGMWKTYDSYTYTWKNADKKTVAALDMLISGYRKLSRVVKVNTDLEDTALDIYTFKFANAVSGFYRTGTAQFYDKDEEDGGLIYKLSSSYTYGNNTLSLFLNGVKLIPGLHYKEMNDTTLVKFLIDIHDYEEDTVIETDKGQCLIIKDTKKDIVHYVIEPLENGETIGYRTITLTQKDCLQPNIYRISSDLDFSMYPGRITVFLNGIRLSKNEWNLIDNKTIQIKFDDYICLGSNTTWPEVTYINEGKDFSIRHYFPDYITVEIRQDYDKNEHNIIFDGSLSNEINLDKYELPSELLDTADEILFYMNGQYTGLSRLKEDYYLDKTKNCIRIMNPEILAAMNYDPLSVLLSKKNNLTAWQKITGRDKYIPNTKNKITLIWR